MRSGSVTSDGLIGTRSGDVTRRRDRHRVGGGGVADGELGRRRDRATTSPPLEAGAFAAINGLPRCALAGRLGAGAGGQPRGIVGRRRRDRSRHPATPRSRVAALVASQGAYWGAKVVKHLAARARPRDLLADVARARAGDRTRIRVGTLRRGLRARDRARAGAPAPRGASCRSRSRPSWSSAVCTPACTCRSTSSAASGSGSSPGRRGEPRAGRRRPACCRVRASWLDEVPPLEVVEAEPARAAPGAST